jgi:hypothetical protein
MIFGPMTLIVAVVTGVFLVAGILILRRGCAADSATEPRRCPHCQNANPRRARYCAGCGQKLD